MITRLVVLLTLILLGACGGGGGGTEPNAGNGPSSGGSSDVASDEIESPADAQSAAPPVIESILTDIWQGTNFVGGVLRVLPEPPTITFTVNAIVTDEDGIDDLDYVYVEHADSDLKWYLLEPVDTENRASCFRSDSQDFECNFFSIEQLHSIALHDWQIVAADVSGNETIQAFEFKLPDGNAATGYETVHSAAFTGDTSASVAALEALTYDRNDIDAWLDYGSELFHLDFVATDARIDTYWIQLWAYIEEEGRAPSESWFVIGWIPNTSPTLASTPIAANLETSLDIPFSEAILNEGYSPEDIDGAHIVVFDEAEQIGESRLWANHAGLSEFIPIPDKRGIGL